MNRKTTIRTVFADVDGTLTDGKIHEGNTGELFKSFYCRDGIGLQNLQTKGIDVVILTSRSSTMVDVRAKELGIKHVIQGVGADGKLEVFLRFVEGNQLKRENIAYVEDDVNDLGCMKYVGYVGCPQDAVSQVKAVADFISSYCGGKGAVREFADWILQGMK